MEHNVVSKASVPLGDVYEAGKRALSPRGRAKAERAEAAARHAREQARLDAARNGLVEAERAAFLRHRLADAGTVAEARMLSGMNPAVVAAALAPFGAADMAASSLATAYRASRLARAAGVPLSHPVWPRLAEYTRRAGFLADATRANAYAYALSPVAAAARTLDDPRSTDAERADALLAIGLAAAGGRNGPRGPFDVNPGALGTGIVDLVKAGHTAELLAAGRRLNPDALARLQRIEAAVRAPWLASGMKDLPLAPAKSAAPKAPLSPFMKDSPGEAVLPRTDRNGQVTLELSDPGLFRRFGDDFARFRGRSVSFDSVPAMVADENRAPRTAAERKAFAAELSAAVFPRLSYQAYRADVESLNRSLERRVERSPLAGHTWIDEDAPMRMHVLPAGSAEVMATSPVGTAFRLRTRGDLGTVDFYPSHASPVSWQAWSRSEDLRRAYNAGSTLLQSLWATAAPVELGGRPLLPTLKLTNHHENVYDTALGRALLPAEAEGLGLRVAEDTSHPRTYVLNGTLPWSGGMKWDGRGVQVAHDDGAGGTVAPEAARLAASVGLLPGDGTRQDAKGGGSPHGKFRNFLATDEVPGSVFGIPVVQDESGYTEKDVAFFRENPRAAGFYEMGDEEMDEDVPQQAAGKGAGDTAGIPEAEYEYTREKDRTPIDPKDIKGTGISFTEKNRRRVPERNRKDFEREMDRIAAHAPNLVPPDWRTNTEYNKDYDFEAAYLAGKMQPMRAKDGLLHMSDAGKLPTHPTFSTESFYAKLPKYKPLAGHWDAKGRYVRGKAEIDAVALHKREAMLKQTWGKAVSRIKEGHSKEDLAKVVYYLFSEGSPFQKGQGGDSIINGHRVRLGVSVNDAGRQSENKHNNGRTFSALDNLVNRSTAPSYGQGSGTNFVDTAAHEPRYTVLARTADSARVAAAAITNGVDFLNGDFKHPGLPSDAYFYGDGTGAFSHGAAKDLSAEELKRLGTLPKGFRVGRAKEDAKGGRTVHADAGTGGARRT